MERPYNIKTLQLFFSGSFRNYNGFTLSMLCIEPYLDSSINKILRNVSNDERVNEKTANVGGDGSSSR